MEIPEKILDTGSWRRVRALAWPRRCTGIGSLRTTEALNRTGREEGCRIGRGEGTTGTECWTPHSGGQQVDCAGPW